VGRATVLKIPAFSRSRMYLIFQPCLPGVKASEVSQIEQVSVVICLTEGLKVASFSAGAVQATCDYCNPLIMSTTYQIENGVPRIHNITHG